MIKYRSLEEIENYRASPAISQSLLKHVLRGSKVEYKETLPMILGSLLDCILTSPNLTDKIYSPSMAKRPSAKIQEIVDEVLVLAMDEESPDSSFEFWEPNLLAKAREKEYQSRWGDDAIINAIKKDALSYWNEKVENKDKTLITQEEWDNMFVVAGMIKSSSITGRYFLEQPKVDIEFQLPLYWNVDDTPCKGLLDQLIIEHETKTIYIVDFKSSTAGTIQDWFQIARQKAYHFQMAWYYKGVEENYKDLISQGYKIECRWVVVPLTGKFNPWIVPCTTSMLEAGKWGHYTFKTILIDNTEKPPAYKEVSSQRKGWLEALFIYQDCIAKGYMDFDYMWNELNGKIGASLADDLFF